MFGFLKEKLKSAISIFSKKVEEEVDEKPKKKEAKKPEKKEEKPKKIEKKEAPKVEKKEKIIEKKPEKVIEKKEEPKKETKLEKEIKEEIKEHKELKKEEEKKEEEKGFFGRLKEKILGKEEELEEEVEEAEEEIEEKKPEKKEAEVEKAEEKEPELEEEVEEEIPEEEEEPEEEKEEEEEKGFFGKISDVFTKKTLSDSKFEELFYDLEIAMLENNVALVVIEKIKEDMRKKLVDKKLKRSELDNIVIDSLKESIDEILSQEKIDFIKTVKQKKPFVICFFGINGSGKTTTIAKIAHFLQHHKISVVLAAADTFRAAAIDQLEKHGMNIGVKVIKQGYGSDAAAVAFDAIQHAKAHNIDVVLIDTAGRSHSNVNLMDELKKIIRVANPDMKIFVGDSLTGNDMVEQADKYATTIGVDGIVLAKADADEKGGATISASYVTKKPIIFLGMGQDYEDIEYFDKEKIMKNLGF